MVNNGTAEKIIDNLNHSKLLRWWSDFF